MYLWCSIIVMNRWASVIFCYCVYIVSISINSPSPCWCTLYTSNKCSPSQYRHYLLSWWFFSVWWQYVCDLYWFLCMLYMIDWRPVIISALYPSIRSVFVDVMFHIHSSGLLDQNDPLSIGLFFLLYLVPLTHLHHADAHFTLLISSHPAH